MGFLIILVTTREAASRMRTSIKFWRYGFGPVRQGRKVKKM